MLVSSLILVGMLVSPFFNRISEMLKTYFKSVLGINHVNAWVKRTFKNPKTFLKRFNA